jgi:hypothetical protein
MVFSDIFLFFSGKPKIIIFETMKGHGIFRNFLFFSGQPKIIIFETMKGHGIFRHFLTYFELCRKEKSDFRKNTLFIPVTSSRFASSLKILDNSPSGFEKLRQRLTSIFPFLSRPFPSSLFLHPGM